MVQTRLDTSRIPLWYDKGVLEGKCPKCGFHRMGWALRNPRHQTCHKCGVELEITEDGRRVLEGYSPFTAERYSINPPTDVSPSPSREQEEDVPNE